MENENTGLTVAENTAETTSGAETTSVDAAQKETFEDLIKGKYRDDFQKKVQGIIEARFKKERAERERENASFREEKAKATYDTLRSQHEEMLRDYPDFNLKEELKNDRFRTLVSFSDIDLKTAYEVVHLQDVVAKATQSAKEKTALGFMSVKQRPSDVIGTGGTGVNAVAALSKKERAELCRRAAAGERLTLK